VLDEVREEDDVERTSRNARQVAGVAFLEPHVPPREGRDAAARRRDGGWRRVDADDFRDARREEERGVAAAERPRGGACRCAPLLPEERGVPLAVLGARS
jgi:hypothetical protein